MHFRSEEVIYPYPGLRPFRENEASIFFGRRKHENILLEKLRKFGCAFLIGPSGCGKSSLVCPGLFQALQSGRRLQDTTGNWEFLTFTPRKTPIQNLYNCLHQTFRKYNKDLPVEHVLPHPEDYDESSLLYSIQSMPLIDAENNQAQLLLVIDQFEQIFSVFKDEQHSFATHSQFKSRSKLFIENLINLYHSIPDHVSNVYLVFTMRSDFLSDCTLFEGLPELVNRTQVLMPTMGEEQIAQALFFPAESRNVNFQPELKTEILEGIRRLRNTEYKRGFDFLPLAQHLMQRLWLNSSDRRGRHQSLRDTVIDLHDYEEVGGLNDALTNHAEELYAFSDREDKNELQKITRIVFTRLAAKAEEGRYVSKNARYSSLLTLINYIVSEENAEEQLDFVLNIFMAEDCSFIRTDEESRNKQDQIYFIGHEALIRQWERLRNWVDDDTKLRSSFESFSQSTEKKRVQNAVDLKGDLRHWKNIYFKELTDKFIPDEKWYLNYFDAEENASEFQNLKVKYKQGIDEDNAQKKKQNLNKALLSISILVLVLAALLLSSSYFKEKRSHQKIAELQHNTIDNLFSNHMDVNNETVHYIKDRKNKPQLIEYCLKKLSDCYTYETDKSMLGTDKMKLIRYHYSGLLHYKWNRGFNREQIDFNVENNQYNRLSIINLDNHEPYLYLFDFTDPQSRVMRHENSSKNNFFELNEDQLFKSCDWTKSRGSNYKLKTITLGGKDFLAVGLDGKCVSIGYFRQDGNINSIIWKKLLAQRSNDAEKSQVHHSIEFLSSDSFALINTGYEHSNGGTGPGKNITNVSLFNLINDSDVVKVSRRDNFVIEDNQSKYAGKTKADHIEKYHLFKKHDGDYSLVFQYTHGNLEVWELNADAESTLRGEISNLKYIENVAQLINDQILILQPYQVLRWKPDLNPQKNEFYPVLLKAQIGGIKTRYELSGDNQFLYVPGNPDINTALPTIKELDLIKGQTRTFIVDSENSSIRHQDKSFIDFFLSADDGKLMSILQNGQLVSWDTKPGSWSNLFALNGCSLGDKGRLRGYVDEKNHIVLGEYGSCEALKNINLFTEKQVTESDNGKYMLLNDSDKTDNFQILSIEPPEHNNTKSQSDDDRMVYRLNQEQYVTDIQIGQIGRLVNNKSFAEELIRLGDIGHKFIQCQSADKQQQPLKIQCAMFIEMNLQIKINNTPVTENFLFVSHTVHEDIENMQ